MSARKLAEAVGWESSYNTVYSLASLIVHSSVRSANDYLTGDPGLPTRVEAGPGGTHVGLALDAWMYLLEVFKDWYRLIKPPQAMLDELAVFEKTLPGGPFSVAGGGASP